MVRVAVMGTCARNIVKNIFLLWVFGKCASVMVEWYAAVNWPGLRGRVVMYGHSGRTWKPGLFVIDAKLIRDTVLNGTMDYEGGFPFTNPTVLVKLSGHNYLK